MNGAALNCVYRVVCWIDRWRFGVVCRPVKGPKVHFEFDSKVYELTRRNIGVLDRTIDLMHGDFGSMLDRHHLPRADAIIIFVALPRGTALDEAEGLDLRRTEPPITEIIARVGQTYPDVRSCLQFSSMRR